MMDCCSTYKSTAVREYDPTHTLILRNLFGADCKRRFKELTMVVKKSVQVNDAFGLKEIQIAQMVPAAPGAFAYLRSQDKLSAFMKWLDQQVQNGILEIRDLQQVGTGIDGAWTNKYLFDSYKRGIIRARSELIRAGYPVPSLDDSGGIEMIMDTPFHIDRIGLIFTRAFSDLKGITAEMEAQISRILAQGLADGDSPALLARKLIATINGTGLGDLAITDTLGRFIPAARRADMLARTEIIRAHHLATIQEYRNWAVSGVFVKAEWKTAGDDRVCEKCAKNEGKIYTLDEIEGLIPYHPYCRCIALPVLINKN